MITNRGDGERIPGAGHELPLLDVGAARRSFDHHGAVVAPAHQAGLRERGDRLEVHAVAAGVPTGGRRAQSVGVEDDWSTFGVPAARIAAGDGAELVEGAVVQARSIGEIRAIRGDAHVDHPRRCLQPEDTAGVIDRAVGELDPRPPPTAVHQLGNGRPCGRRWGHGRTVARLPAGGYRRSCRKRNRSRTSATRSALMSASRMLSVCAAPASTSPNGSMIRESPLYGSPLPVPTRLQPIT